MKIIDSVKNKLSSVSSIISVVDHTTMETLPEPSINMVSINTVSSKPCKEVELRLSPDLARDMYRKMDEGLFPDADRRIIREVGCSWWTGKDSNINAKVRKRSNGEAVVKVTRSRVRVAPGYVLAHSDEYGFDGTIMKVMYDVSMTEIRSSMIIRDTVVNVIARMYTNDRATSYAAEFEIEGRCTNMVLRAVLCLAMSTIGVVKKMRGEIDPEFVSDVKSSDHAVVDVPSLVGYRGRFRAKSDGIKVYVFCYNFGHVVCITDPDLTTTACMVTVTHRDLPEMTRKPDVVCAEMHMDGSLVYISTLAINGNGRLPESMDIYKTPLRTERPNFILRTEWDTMPTKIQLELEPTPNDRIVLVSRNRTLRLKEPTVDLMYSDGKLCASDGGVMTPLADGSTNMEQNTIYEMDVIKYEDTDGVRLVRPRQRILKKIPNSMDVVKRAIASATKDPTINATLMDMTSMSFSMRKRVYTMAQAKAPPNRKVIVTFGAGRFQEWKEMMVEGFSYIAIDPDIDITDLARRMKRSSILAYDFNTSFNTQVLSISKRGSTVLYAKCRSEYFIYKTMPTMVMATVGIPAVFSFSISYHIGVINKLRSGGVPTFGCDFVHDAMPRSGVGREPVTMKPRNGNRASSSDIISTFGKSTYVEPYLSRSSAPGLVLVRDAMPDLWRTVDSNTVDVMDRAVIMF